MQRTDLPPTTLQTGPSLHPTSFIAKNASVMGDVRMKQYSSIWYNAVARGDINFIEIGERSNVQDGSILHLENTLPCIIGNDVTVGHHVNLHGCTIEDACLIGIGAIVLSGAVIGRGSIVAAGAVVREKQVVEPFTMVAGIPAKPIKKLDESTFENQKKWAAKYVEVARIHREKIGAGNALGI